MRAAAPASLAAACSLPHAAPPWPVHGMHTGRKAPENVYPRSRTRLRTLESEAEPAAIAALDRDEKFISRSVSCAYAS